MAENAFFKFKKNEAGLYCLIIGPEPYITTSYRFNEIDARAFESLDTAAKIKIVAKTLKDDPMLFHQRQPFESMPLAERLIQILIQE